MKTTSTERMRKTRRRRRFGMRCVTVEVPAEAIELLEQQGYLETRSRLDLLGADHAVEHEAQRITAIPSTLPFIALVGGVAAAWPLAAHAQQEAKLPRSHSTASSYSR